MKLFSLLLVALVSLVSSAHHHRHRHGINDLDPTKFPGPSHLEPGTHHLIPRNTSTEYKSIAYFVSWVSHLIRLSIHSFDVILIDTRQSTPETTLRRKSPSIN